MFPSGYNRFAHEAKRERYLSYDERKGTAIGCLSSRREEEVVQRTEPQVPSAMELMLKRAQLIAEEEFDVYYHIGWRMKNRQETAARKAAYEEARRNRIRAKAEAKLQEQEEYTDPDNGFDNPFAGLFK